MGTTLKKGNLQPMNFVVEVHLKELFKKILRSPPFYKVRQALMDLHEISEETFLDWLHSNKPELITADSVALICAYIKVDPQDLLSAQAEDSE